MGVKEMNSQYHADFLPNREGTALFYVIEGDVTNAEQVLFICGPMLEEKIFGQPVIRQFSQYLVEQGFVVIRFDYRGDGDSAGCLGSATLEQLTNDAEDVLMSLVEQYQFKEPVVMGVRLGAAIAALLAQRISCRSLLYWYPILDGSKYIQQLLRFNLTLQLFAYNCVKKDRKALIEQTKSGESVNILGHEIGDNFLSSTENYKFKEVSLPLHCSQFVITTEKEVRLLAEGISLDVAEGLWKTEVVDLKSFWHEPKRYGEELKALFVRSSAVLEGNHDGTSKA